MANLTQKERKLARQVAARIEKADLSESVLALTNKIKHLRKSKGATLTSKRAVSFTAPKRVSKENHVAPRSNRGFALNSTQSLKILFVASECAPFAKTGGLGDVVPGLSKALRRLGHHVRIVIPLYSWIDYNRFGLKPAAQSSVCVHMGNGEENWVGVHETMLDGEVPVWFVDYSRFFARPGIYGDGGGDYGDNAFRFGLLSKAALQISKDTKFIPDIIHLHDWPAAPVAAFLKTWDHVNSPLSNTASVLTIHNVGHQGVYHPSAMAYYGLGNEHFTPEKFEDHGKMNLLKAAVHFADAITTVSPTHAAELLDPSGAKGLAPFLNARKNDFSGILNGVDHDHWNPAVDPLIPAQFSRDNLEGKAVCKAALQDRFQLQRDPKVPLFGIISRFAPQKGFDLLKAALPGALNDMKFQLVVLGSGDPDTENFFRWLSAAYPGRANAHIGYSEEVGHLIEAGSDFFLMPSLYEPCGLNQIYSLKYGTLPVVRATGGLEDTVRNYDEKTGDGTGFKFIQPNAAAIYNTIGWAVSTWFDRPEDIDRMRQSAMSEVFSWDTAAADYDFVYQRALANRRR